MFRIRRNGPSRVVHTQPPSCCQLFAFGWQNDDFAYRFFPFPEFPVYCLQRMWLYALDWTECNSTSIFSSFMSIASKNHKQYSIEARFSGRDCTV